MTRARVFGVIASCAIAITISSSASAGDRKLSADLEQRSTDETVDVIVQYRETPTAEAHYRVVGRGGVLKHELGVIKARHYSLPARVLAELAEDPNVAYITPDRQVKAHLDYGFTTIQANLASTFSVDGKGVGVAVIDSGIATHFDLPYPVYQQTFGTTDLTDLFGHGTHVAGIIAGNGSSSTGSSYTYTIQGVAKGVSLINLKVLDANGVGTDSSVIAAIQKAISLKSKYNIKVMKLSLGRPVAESYTKDPLCQAVEQAWKAGIVVVVAAGNYGRANPTTTYGYGTITAPGNDPYVITVGAMNTRGTAIQSDDVIASYSSKGPTLYDTVVKPDLVAPGNLVSSTLSGFSSFPTTYPTTDIAQSLYSKSGGSSASMDYIQLSGTSMAAPFVSGTAALLLQQRPTLTPDQVKAILMMTANKTFPATSSYTDTTVTPNVTYKEQYDIFTVGAGYLNVDAALASNVVPTAGVSAMSPSAILNAKAGNATMVNGQNVIWGSN